MTENLHEGIILRNYIPAKQKLCLLDSRLGRIECIPKFKQSANRLFTGAHVLYTISNSNFGHIISNTNILNFPSHLIRNNFLFLHHVLELCYYFLPLDQESKFTFDWILTLYNNPAVVETDLSKKIFLCQFFVNLGIYPNNLKQDNLIIFNLISGSLDSNLKNKDIKIVCDDLQRWLINCINSHPYVYKFKTLKFLKTK